MAAARDEGFKTGFREGQKTTPTDSAPSSASEEEVGRRVKTIMNHTYQTVAERLKSKEEFQRSEVLSVLLATIKVGVAKVGVVTCDLWVWSAGDNSEGPGTTAGVREAEQERE